MNMVHHNIVFFFVFTFKEIITNNSHNDYKDECATRVKVYTNALSGDFQEMGPP